MGKKSRRHRSDNRGGQDGQGDRGGHVQYAEGVALVAEAILRGREIIADQISDALTPMWDAGVADAASDALRTATVAAWEHGWQPADLVHAVGRKLTAPDRRLLIAVAVADAGEWRQHPTPDPAWLDQVDELEGELSTGPPTGAVGSGGVVGSWARMERVVAPEALRRAATLLGVLWGLPRLPPIGDPPSAWGRARPRPQTAPAPAGIDERMLNRVRALLSKAESTEFAPEAEALTAKAQELMARYSIDQALVAAAGSGPGVGEAPRSRRVLIHDPYAKGKSYLLAEVAGANRCEAVWSKDAGFSSVFGFSTDLAVTDILYTSLVSQCSSAMVTASKDIVQPRRFRESFVLSFAIHIGKRLAAATAATVAEAAAELGDSLLPVLAARTDQVEAARDEAFPSLRANRIRVTDGRGWAAGQAAAELAHLEAGKAVEG